MFFIHHSLNLRYQLATTVKKGVVNPPTPEQRTPHCLGQNTWSQYVVSTLDACVNIIIFVGLLV